MLGVGGSPPERAPQSSQARFRPQASLSEGVGRQGRVQGCSVGGGGGALGEDAGGGAEGGSGAGRSWGGAELRAVPMLGRSGG